ncbi:hypothetical protein ABTP36_19780, partial [Acinetobacter baumannii]
GDFGAWRRYAGLWPTLQGSNPVAAGAQQAQASILPRILLVLMMLSREGAADQQARQPAQRKDRGRASEQGAASTARRAPLQAAL